jgi:hypothetical protein
MSERGRALRALYGGILQLHPAWFRERFGGEMMWIFEAEAGRGSMRLLADGVVSLVRQRVAAGPAPRPVMGPFGLLDSGGGMAPRRFVEAGLAACLFLAAFMILLGSGGRVFSGPACVPGAPRVAPVLEAPSRVRAVPGGRPRVASAVNPAQVDSSVASAVALVRADEARGPGFCVQDGD